MTDFHRIKPYSDPSLRLHHYGKVEPMEDKYPPHTRLIVWVLGATVPWLALYLIWRLV